MIRFTARTTKYHDNKEPYNTLTVAPTKMVRGAVAGLRSTCIADVFFLRWGCALDGVCIIVLHGGVPTHYIKIGPMEPTCLVV